MLEGMTSVSREFADFVQEVRAFLRDYPELNRLVAGEESSDRQIAWAIMDAVDNFNGTPHFTNYSLESLLVKGQKHLLVRMAVITLLESVALLQARNQLSYSDGGITISTNDKSPLLMNWIQYFKNVTEQKMVRVKVSMNIEDALEEPGVFSEYWDLHSLYSEFY